MPPKESVSGICRVPCVRTSPDHDVPATWSIRASIAAADTVESAVARRKERLPVLMRFG